MQLPRHCVESTMSTPTNGHASVENSGPANRRDNVVFDRRLDQKERLLDVEVGPV